MNEPQDGIRAAKRNRIYSRKFDWDKARDMREAGHTWAHIARTLDVTPIREQREAKRLKRLSEAA